MDHLIVVERSYGRTKKRRDDGHRSAVKRYLEEALVLCLDKGLKPFSPEWRLFKTKYLTDRLSKRKTVSWDPQLVIIGTPPS